MRRDPGRFGAALTALLIRTGLCRLLKIRTHGVVVRFTPAAMCRMLWMNPGVYDDDLAFYGRYLRPGDTVVDAGANIGLVTLVAARLVSPGGVIHAIEPHPGTFADLQANVRLNRAGHVVLHRAALDAAAGTLTLAEFPGDDSQNFVRPRGPGLAVPAVRLDDLLSGTGPVGLLKIDVEGYERFVLRGAEAVLRRTACVVVESWAPLFARYGYECRDVFGELMARGFALYRREGAERVAPVGVSDVSVRCENIMAVRDVGAWLDRTGYRLTASDVPVAGRPSRSRT